MLSFSCTLLQLPPVLVHRLYSLPYQITYLDQYYLTNCEIALLEKHAADIAKNIPDRSIVVELGSG